MSAAAEQAATDAAAKQLAPSALFVRCSARGVWPPGKQPGVLIEALSKYPHETHYVDLDFDGDTYDGEAVEFPTGLLGSANTITSRINDGEHEGSHTIALDVDVPVRVVPSSTPGHSHVYIDVPVQWHAYERLLAALAECGVIEQGFANVSVQRGFTRLRLPWIRKTKGNNQ